MGRFYVWRVYGISYPGEEYPWFPIVENILCMLLYTRGITLILAVVKVRHPEEYTTSSGVTRLSLFCIWVRTTGLLNGTSCSWNLHFRKVIVCHWWERTISRCCNLSVKCGVFISNWTMEAFSHKMDRSYECLL